jgi:hypothetical protein
VGAEGPVAEDSVDGEEGHGYEADGEVGHRQTEEEVVGDRLQLLVDLEADHDHDVADDRHEAEAGRDDADEDDLPEGVLAAELVLIVPAGEVGLQQTVVEVRRQSPPGQRHIHPSSASSYPASLPRPRLPRNRYHAAAPPEILGLPRARSYIRPTAGRAPWLPGSQAPRLPGSLAPSSASGVRHHDHDHHHHRRRLRLRLAVLLASGEQRQLHPRIFAPAAGTGIDSSSSSSSSRASSSAIREARASSKGMLGVRGSGLGATSGEWVRVWEEGGVAGPGRNVAGSHRPTFHACRPRCTYRYQWLLRPLEPGFLARQLTAQPRGNPPTRLPAYPPTQLPAFPPNPRPSRPSRPSRPDRHERHACASSAARLAEFARVLVPL